jgi:hypothetical protein
MKTSRLFKVENKLSEITSRPGGRRISDALHAAEAKVQEKHGDLAAALPVAGARLKDLVDGADANPDVALDALYTEANQLFALAAALDMKALASAAYSLCDVADSFRDSGEISWQALHVHVDSIRLLVQGTGSAEADAAILEGLRQVGARFLKPAESAAKA